MSRVDEQFEEQRASNESGLPHFDAFREHRQQQTQLIERQLDALAPEIARAARLCVLGAGNCYDLELPQLLTRVAEVHLVDIDRAALEGARARLPEALRPRVIAHAPIDLSGWFEHLERWARMQVTPQELMTAPAAGSKRIAEALPGPFEVVVSSCLLTQLQLSLLNAMGDRHQLFVALREFLTLTHLRTLSRLTRPGGRALLITDLCEARAFPAGRPRDTRDLKPLMDEMVQAGHVIHSAHPGLINVTLGDDPVLLRTFGPAEQAEPWLWQNGPAARFLVYALALPRSG